MTKISTSIGNIEIRDLNLEIDFPHIYTWVSQEHARFWGMTEKNRSEVMEEYKRVNSTHHTSVFIGLINGHQKFLFEKYLPSKEPVGKHFPVLDDDCGIHLLVAPPVIPVHNFTHTIFSTVMDFIFMNEKINRIVIEPDVRNDKMIKLSKRIGFRFEKNIKLPHKEAALGFCIRQEFFDTKINSL